MKLLLRLSIVSCVVACVVPAIARASEPLSSELVVGGGVVHLLEPHDGTQWVGMLEYRFEETKWGVRPWLGAAVSDAGTHWVSAGLLYTYVTSGGFRFSAGFAPSYYDDGGGRDLGSTLNFYSFGEAGYGFENGHSVNLRIGHLSNGGLAERNPGTETLMLTYTLPISRRR